MTLPIQYDPMLKVTIRDRLFALLYVPADTQMFDRKKDIIMKNAVLVHASHASFMYKAVNYTCDSNPVLPRPRNQLDPRLEGRMNEYLDEMKYLAEEKPLVQNYLTQVLNASDHPADWLQLLIPALRGPVQTLLDESASNFAAAKRMTEAAIEAFLVKNQSAIDRTKQRLVTNLITT